MFGLIPFRTNNGVSEAGDSFDNFVNSFFNDDFSTMFSGSGKFNADIKESADKYTVKADLPGVKKEDVSLEYNNGYLTVSAKRDEDTKDEKENYIRRERRYGEFSRSFYVDNVDEANIKAKFENGELKVVLPKKQIEEPKVNKITIE